MNPVTITMFTNRPEMAWILLPHARLERGAAGSPDNRRQRADRGVVAASSGNHGLGVAHALSALGGKGIVCVPEVASQVKVAAIRRYGVEVRVMGQEPAATERLARLLAAEARMSYISPYNDLDVIAGQGTVGEEIVQ